MKRSIVWVILPVFFLFLLPCTASAQDAVIPGIVSPQVTGTAGISTGLVKIGYTSTTIPPLKPSIDWGDGTGNSPVLLDCSLVNLLTQCNYWNEHVYKNAGTYKVTVDYGLRRSFTAEAVIAPVGNFVIVSIGDSVASGEGNPVVPSRIGAYPHGPYWDTNVQHGCTDQSSRAAPVLAASELQAANPGARITILHMACSGAHVDQAGKQLSQAESILNGKKIDALLITAGADNIDGGFSNVVLACTGPAPGSPIDGSIIPEPTFDCTKDNETLIDNGDPDAGSSDEKSDPKTMRLALAGIPSDNLDFPTLNCDINPKYDIKCPAPHVDTDVRDTYITQYFDPSHDSSGNIPNLGESAACTGLLMLPDEWYYLYENMVIPLNEQIQYYAGQYGWHYVDGIQRDFLKHGYCAGSNSWVVSLPQSIALQENVSGTSHPNAAGQNDYAERFVQAINQYTPPTTVATATSAGKPYMFGTWTTHDVEVSFKATNKLTTAGVSKTYFSEDDSTCSDTSPQSCMVYQGTFTMDQNGKHTLYFFSSNKSGTLEKVDQEQVWIDNAPPVMNCYATPSVLWAPNHKLVPVNLDVTAVSAAFGPTPFTLTSVTTSEGNPATDIQGFTLGKPSTQGWLRASRTGTQRAGRVYTFTYKSADPLGLTSSCATTVTVPHDHGRR